MLKNNCILYRHIRLDKNEPFYIGISNNVRRPYNSTLRNNIWKSIASKTEYRVDILFDDLTWEEACDKEKEFIKLYGRINTQTGILSNMTNGGDGSLGNKFMLGKKLSKETKDKISYGNKGKKLSEETKNRIGKSNTGKTRSESVRSNLSNKHKGKKLSDEVKEKISDGNKGKRPWNKGKKYTKEQKKNLTGRTPWNKGKKLSEEHIQKLKDNHKGNKGTKHSEETKLRMSESAKNRTK